jgi:DnaD/phage-associated family protein
LIESDFGVEGFGIVIKLLMKIYSEGYFYEWGEMEQKLFSRRVNVNNNLLSEVVNACIRWRVFNKRLFEKYQILTSPGIQKRYLEATTRRKDVEIIEEYILLSKSDISKYSNIVIVNIDDDSKGVNVDINSNSSEPMPTETPQSKVKESRVKERKVEESMQKEKNDGDDNLSPMNSFADFQTLWMFPNEFQKEDLLLLIEEHGDDLVSAAIKIAGSKDVPKRNGINFIEAVLKEWENANVKDLEQAREYQRNRNKVRSKGQFNNNKPRKQESLPDWESSTQDDEIVEDESMSERLARIREMRGSNER